MHDIIFALLCVGRIYALTMLQTVAMFENIMTFKWTPGLTFH